MRLSPWALCALLILNSQAAIVRVPGEQPTIQAGIDAAAEGDTVLVAPGTYSGEGNREIDFHGIDRVLMSSAGAEKTVIELEFLDWWRGFYMHSGESAACVVRGFTIRGATLVDYGGGFYCQNSHPTIADCIITDNWGGGLYCRDSDPTIERCVIAGNREFGGVTATDSSPILKECWVIENRCDNRGGGLRLSNSAARLTNCTIEGNTSSSSAGGGIHLWNSSPTLTNCTISENLAREGFGGGVSCREGSSPSLIECLIRANSADRSGGGLSCNGEGCSPTLVACSIRENSADWSGGGLSCDNEGCAPTLKDCSIESNTAADVGGAVSCGDHASPSLTQCTIAGNAAKWGGGALFASSHTEPSLINCTLVGNSSPAGGGLYSAVESRPSLTNCILWNDALAEIEVIDGNPHVTYSAIRGGWPGEGNIGADPRFCDVSCGQPRNLRLAVDSPCLGAGRGGADIGAWGEGCEDPVVTSPTLLEVPEEFPSISTALAAACLGDTIVLAPGSYHESGLEVPPLGLRVQSQNPGDAAVVTATIVDGGGEDVIYLGPSRIELAATLAGITVTGGGRGLEVLGTAASIDRCRIVGNQATFYKWGAGIHCDRSPATLTRCTIAENVSPAVGGGLCCENASPTLIRCRIVGNSAYYYGGGLSLSSSSPQLINCVIMANQAEDDGGSAIDCDSSSPKLENCTITNNSTGSRGVGAVLCRDLSSPTLINCTIANNSAGSRGAGGIHCQDSSAPNLKNCILWGDTPYEVNNGPHEPGNPTIEYCNVQGGHEGFGNISISPGLISWLGFDHMLNPVNQWVGDTYVLRSACIDARDPGIEDRISDWHPRWPDWYPNGPRSDMGAYGGPGNFDWVR